MEPLREVEPLIDEREGEEEVRELLALAEQLEGLHAQRRHARGRRADRAGQAHRLLPAVRRRRAPMRSCRSSTRTTSRRSGLVKFDFLGLTTLTILDWRCATCAGSIRRRRSTLETLPLDDARAYEIFKTGNTTARVPVRIARHARAADAGAARPLRGHHRAGRAVSPGPDGAHSRLHRAQAGERARRVSRPAPRADPRRRPTASWCTRNR